MQQQNELPTETKRPQSIRYCSSNYKYTTIFDNFGQRWAIIVVKFASQMEKIAITVEVWDILLKNAENVKKSQVQTSKTQQTNVNKINTTTNKSDVEESVKHITSYQQLYNQVYDSVR